MRALVIGSGGRESALVHALASSKVVTDLLAAPGNPGMEKQAEVLELARLDPSAILELSRRVRANLVVIGPEAPLVAGAVDALRSDGFKVFGPLAAAARIEGSKSYAKELMDAARIPTARWQAFDDVGKATAYLDELGPPHVVKANGLAAGKGVVVTPYRAEAIAALEAALVHDRFGSAGSTVVIEEFLEGQEASLIAFTDGSAVVPCEPAQDYKRIFDDDRGPNTGGMGSYSPVPVCPPDLAAQIAEEILKPMVRATAERGFPFSGALYAGLALTPDGPKVVEFNARFGDPETQALLPRLQSDFGELCIAAADNSLAGVQPRWDTRACVCVVLASSGYPGSHETGYPISGADEAESLTDVHVFHAGTARRGEELVTAGGRVLGVSALGDSFAAARRRVYEAAELIDFEGKHLRTDIARRVDGEAL